MEHRHEPGPHQKTLSISERPARRTPRGASPGDSAGDGPGSDRTRSRVRARRARSRPRPRPAWTVAEVFDGRAIVVEVLDHVERQDGVVRASPPGPAWPDRPRPAPFPAGRASPGSGARCPRRRPDTLGVRALPGSRPSRSPRPGPAGGRTPSRSSRVRVRSARPATRDAGDQAAEVHQDVLGHVLVRDPFRPGLIMNRGAHGRSGLRLPPRSPGRPCPRLTPGGRPVVGPVLADDVESACPWFRGRSDGYIRR